MLSHGSVSFSASIPTITVLCLPCTAEPRIAAGSNVCILVGARDELPRRPDQPPPRLRVLLGLSGQGHGLQHGCSIGGCTARLIESERHGWACCCSSACICRLRLGDHRRQHHRRWLLKNSAYESAEAACVLLSAMDSSPAAISTRQCSWRSRTPGQCWK